MQKDCSSLVAFLAAIPLANALGQVPCEHAMFPNPLSVGSDFGQAVAIRGGSMVVGLPSVTQSGGYAMFYNLDESGWTLAQIEQAPDKAVSDRFGWSCAVDGTHAVIGRRGDGILNSQGSAYTYERQPDGHWTLLQKLTAPVGWWAFGWSMSIDGDRLAIAAKGAASLGEKGRVFIYEFENGQWVEKAVIAPSLDTLGDWLGASVALQGDRLAVGAPKNGTGRAYVFDRQANGTWVQQALFTPPVVTPTGDEYGWAVALDGDTVAVGAIAYDSPVINAGGVFVYVKAQVGWEFQQQLASPPDGTLPRFGHALSLKGDEIYVGAPTNAYPVSSAGCVYRFNRTGGVWTQTAKFFGSEPFASAWFGNAIARDENLLAVAAYAGPSPLPGKVHLFSIGGGAHLQGGAASISASLGGSQPLQLGACPEHAGDYYLILGSLSGTAPALPLGNAELPLVFDSYTLFGLQSPNSPFLPASLGLLDPSGRANAEFRLPPGSVPNLIGQTAHHAFLVLDQATLDVELASNPTPVLIAP
jgi:FG-GAP repeat